MPSASPIATACCAPITAHNTAQRSQTGTESGRLLDFLASRIIEMPRLSKQKGQEGDQARELLRVLGYGSADALDRKRRSAPDDFLPDFLQRLNAIKNPRKQDQALRFTFGRDWLGEGSRIIKGIETYKEAVKLAREAKGLDAIGKVWELHKTKLGFVFKQFRAGWFNVLGEFGKVLSPMARQAGDFWLGWTAKLRSGGLAARFRASLDGLVEGLGFKDLPDLLTRILGQPGESNAGAISAWKATFREFGAGVRDVFGGIRALVNSFTGGSPETIARWTGRILALSGALVILSPVIGVLGGLASGILAIGTAATTALAAFKLAGIAGGTAAGGAATAALTAAGGIIAAGFLATVADHFGILKAPDFGKGIGRGVLEFLDPGLARRWYGDDKPAGNGAWTDPPARVERQSYNGAFDDRPAITRASFVTDRLVDGLDRLGRAVAGRVAPSLSLASITGTSSAAIGAFGGAGGVPGFGSGGSGGGGGGSAPAVPGWYGKGGAGMGGGITAPMLKGAAQANAKTAYDFFRGKGLSHEATAGILASMKAESGFNPGARGDGGRAHGLFQHHPDRRAAILRGTGIDMSTASVEKQLEGAWWEMNHGDAGAQRALGILKRQGISAREAGGAFVQHFERPKRDERASRGALAEGFARQFGPGGGATVSGSGPDVAGGKHPLDGAGRFTSDFGMRMHPKLRRLKFHAGIDLAAPPGTTVKAMRDGTVSVDRSGDVTLKHGDGTTTTYRHLRAGVEHGAKVAAGDAIGRLRADDPRSTGPHLHLESRDANGALRDPKALLAAPPKAQAAVDGFRSSGWKRADGSPYQDGAPSPAAREPTPEDKARAASVAAATARVPLPPRRPTSGPGFAPAPGGAGAGGQGGGQSAGLGGFNVTIHAGNQNPAEMAAHIQRHVTEAWNYRSHDLEPELT